MNDMNRVGHETDYHALSVAQERIDELRWIRSESDLDQELNEYPKTIQYKIDSDVSGTIPFDVDINKTTATIENDDIRSVELRIDVSSDFGVGGEGGNPVHLIFTKSFIK